ncbi:MAG: Bifunctional phosphoglucose/phosphomannose isomerase [Candidatus Levybacteria bacterium GW2011_GWA2_36_13]|nr:MAG: Bifunctional phosphoglucose/phosphomannose isomerase [Candidatus Levybacteria bacterium GW2011_GWA2_36_13]KKP99931.1 MAG: Bifunctional phosphoglucose/phosphomannose isomerase [Candidatus Levybacteria bacterium GW2011_GWB1_36_18]
MINLNDPNSFKHLDPKNVLGSVEMFADQCEQIWNDAKDLDFPSEYRDVQNIVFSGMGGSALGAHFVLSVFKNQLNLPFYLNSSYELPKFASEKSLAILSTYSGTTEETLSSADEAFEKGCKITGLTTGGNLLGFFEEKDLPFLRIVPKFNPSNQPRLGTGYSIMGAIAILSSLGFLKIEDSQVKNSISFIRANQESIKAKAVEISQKIKNKSPLIIVPDFLNGVAHIIRNQLNENSKTFASYSCIPELNHHLMEGLKNPANNNLVGLFLESDLSSNKTKQRTKLTKEIVNKNSIPHYSFEAEGSDILTQALYLVSFGGFLTFYLAMLYEIDPSLIPWVDYFKEELSKSS